MYLFFIRRLSNAADGKLGLLRHLEITVYFISLKMNPFNRNQGFLGRDASGFLLKL
jgi:hypothetical protein